MEPSVSTKQSRPVAQLTVTPVVAQIFGKASIRILIRPLAVTCIQARYLEPLPPPIRQFRASPQEAFHVCRSGMEEVADMIHDRPPSFEVSADTVGLDSSPPEIAAIDRKSRAHCTCPTTLL